MSCDSRAGDFDFGAFVDMEMMLMELKPDDIANVAKSLMETEFVSDVVGISRIARVLHLALTYRPRSLNSYIELLEHQHLSRIFDCLRTELLNVIFHSFHTSWAYPCECASLTFLYRAHKRHMYSDSEMYSAIHSFFCQPKIMYLQRLWIFAYFAPLLTSVDSHIEQQMLRIFRDRRDILLTRPEFISFYDHYEDMKRNEWELHAKQVNQEGTLGFILRNDDINELMRESQHPEFDYDQRIERSLFEPCWFLRDRPTLIQYAIYHNALKCTELLQTFCDIHLQDARNKTTAQFAAACGSPEMMEKCRHWNCNFAGTMRIAAGYFQSDVFFWLLETEYHDQIGVDEWCDDVLLEVAASGNLYLLKYCLGRGINVNGESNKSTPLHYACYIGQIEMVEFLLARQDVDINRMTVSYLFMIKEFHQLCSQHNTVTQLSSKCL